MSYANMDGVPTQTAGTSEILASDWNTYVRDNFDSIKFGHVVCTSSTRPSGVAEGTMIYETDTQKVLVYSGSAWVEISDLDNIGALATNAYNSFKNSSMTTVTAATFSTSSTSFVDATGVSVSITPTSTASKVLVIASVSWGPSTTGNYKYAWKIVGGNTANYTGVASGSRPGTMAGLSPHDDTNIPVTNTYVVLDSPNTTSATTYKVQVAALGGSTVYLNRSFGDVNAGTVSRASSNITAIELIG